MPGLAGKANVFLLDSLPVICGHYEIFGIVWGIISECGTEDDKTISGHLQGLLMPENGALEGADLLCSILGTPGRLLCLLPPIAPRCSNLL